MMLKSIRRQAREFVRGRKPRTHSRPCAGMLDDRLGGWFNQEKNELVAGFTVEPGDTMIDVGCGDGGYSEYAAMLGAQVIATDVDEGSLKIAERRIKNVATADYEIIASDSNPLPIEDGRANRVICIEVMEHVPDPQQFISELVRVASPGAQFLLSVPDPASEGIQKELAPETYWREPNHLRVFSHDDFTSLVEDAGLTIDRQFTRGFFWTVWWAMFWACDQEFGEPEKPPLHHWTESWKALASTPQAKQVKDVLESRLPKSQCIIATKKAA